MEWNNLHAPLQPPKGYEHYHTEQAVFPGLKHPVKFASVREFTDAMRGAWKIYMHHYRHDPEVQQWFDKLGEEEAEWYTKRGERAGEFAGDVVARGRQNIQKMGEDLKAARPGGQRFLKDRTTVLQNAVSEFAAGFYETVDGNKNIWGLTPEEEDEDALAKNVPVVYRVRARDE